MLYGFLRASLKAICRRAAEKKAAAGPISSLDVVGLRQSTVLNKTYCHHPFSITTAVRKPRMDAGVQALVIGRTAQYSYQILESKENAKESYHYTYYIFFFITLVVMQPLGVPKRVAYRHRTQSTTRPCK